MWRARLASITPDDVQWFLWFLVLGNVVLCCFKHGLWPTLVVFWFAMLVAYMICTVLSWCSFWPPTGANPWDR